MSPSPYYLLHFTGPNTNAIEPHCPRFDHEYCFIASSVLLILLEEVSMKIKTEAVNPVSFDHFSVQVTNYTVPKWPNRTEVLLS